MNTSSPISNNLWTAENVNECALFMMWHDNILTEDGNYDQECTIPDLQTAKEYCEARHIRECYYGGTPYLLDRKYTSEEANAFLQKEKTFKEMHLDMRDQIITNEDGKKGLQDVCGNIIIEPQFDDIPERYSCFQRSYLIPVILQSKYYLYNWKEKKLFTKGYDRIFRYFWAYIDYFVAIENGKKGVLDDYDGHELCPIIMDEIYEMQDPDSCIPIVKDGKAGFCDGGMYVEPIYERVQICSEDYTRVWLNGIQGWIDNQGKFTTNKEEACIGSWYDYDK